MNTNDDLGYDHNTVVNIPLISLEDPRIVRIVRIRYLGTSNWLEFSYCIAELNADYDGLHVYVTLDTQFSTARTLKTDLLKEFKARGRYAKGLGVFDAISTYGY